MRVDPAAGGRTSVRRLLCMAAIAIAATGCERKPVVHYVTIRQFRFEPDPVAIAAGDTVEWINRDVVPHTTTARSGRWDSKLIQPNATWRTVPTSRGPEPYGCSLHTNMQGRVDVR